MTVFFFFFCYFLQSYDEKNSTGKIIKTLS